MVAEAAFPRVDSLLSMPEVRALLPRGIELHWSATPESVGRRAHTRCSTCWKTSRSSRAPTWWTRRPQLDPLTNGPHRDLRARPRRRPEVRRRDRPPRGRLHGDRARRAGAGPAAGHPEPHRAHAARSRWAARRLQEAQDLALTLKAGALPDSAQDRRGAPGRREPRRRLDPGRHPGRRRRHAARDPDHGGLLPR